MSEARGAGVAPMMEWLQWLQWMQPPWCTAGRALARLDALGMEVA